MTKKRWLFNTNVLFLGSLIFHVPYLIHNLNKNKNTTIRSSKGGMNMGRQKKGNPNAQRNENKKKQGKNNHPRSYAEVEVEKMRND